MFALPAILNQQAPSLPANSVSYCPQNKNAFASYPVLTRLIELRGDNNLVDTMGSGIVVTRGSNTFNTTAKYGTHSFEIINSNSHLVLNRSPNTNLSVANSTIEFWYRGYVFSNKGILSVGPSLGSTSNSIYTTASSELSVAGTTVLTNNTQGGTTLNLNSGGSSNTWKHLAFVFRQFDRVDIFFNGLYYGYVENNIGVYNLIQGNYGNNFIIGTYASNNNVANLLIDSIVITRGLKYSTANFNPETAPELAY